MDTGIIPMRYARALYAFAKDTKSEEILYNEMGALTASYRHFPEFRTVLDNPVLGNAEKLLLLKSAVGENPSKEYIRFVELVLHHRRENYLQSMALMYIDLYRKEKKIIVGSLTTAVSITPETEAKMKKLLMTDKEGTLEFTTSVDPNLLGGFIFYYDTYRLDASLTTQLKRVKTQLLEKNRKTV